MKNSNISWTDHTFNPWIGCARVSAGCLHCYAERQDNRWRGGTNWGVNATRTVTSDANWRKPLAWNDDAARAGAPAFVFCASFADVFEERDDLVEPRARLFDLIDATPWLVWPLLTKRPENIRGLAPSSWMRDHPRNVWLGTTIENQDVVNDRLNALDAHPAATRFLSVEPMIGPVDLTGWMGHCGVGCSHEHCGDAAIPFDWVIIGGESGPGHRPFELGWARDLIDQCRQVDVPVWFKQVGGNIKIDGEWGGNRLDGETIHERPDPLPVTAA